MSRFNKLLVEMTNNDVPVEKVDVEDLALCHLIAGDRACTATTVQDLCLRTEAVDARGPRTEAAAH